MALFFVNLSQGLNTILIPSVLTSNCVNKKVLRVSFRPGARNLRDCVKLNRMVKLFYIGLHLNYTARLSSQLFSIRLSQIKTPLSFPLNQLSLILFLVEDWC